MSPLEHAEKLARPYGPQFPMPILVERLNQIYHRFEAASYDQNHSEIFEQLPSLWAKMVDYCRPQLDSLGKSLKILDYGCGTGFATSQIISLLGADRIEKMTCYDPSPEMLQKCEERFRGSFPIELLNIAPSARKVDLLLTNSLLHHLPDLASFVRSIPNLLVPGGLWFAGHEPNRSYYLNPECMAFSSQLSRQKRLNQLKSPTAVARFILSRLGLNGSLNQRVAKASLDDGLFSKKPSPLVIERLVDFAVPHDPKEASAGRGIDFSSFPELSQGGLKMQRLQSYNYWGSYYQANPSRELKRRLDNLSSTYPNDAANVFAIFQSVA